MVVVTLFSTTDITTAYYQISMARVTFQRLVLSLSMGFTSSNNAIQLEDDTHHLPKGHGIFIIWPSVDGVPDIIIIIMKHLI